MLFLMLLVVLLFAAATYLNGAGIPGSIVLCVLWLAFIGFGGPFLVSQADTLAVMGGVLTLFLLGALTYIHFSGGWRQSDECPGGPDVCDCNKEISDDVQ